MKIKFINFFKKKQKKQQQEIINLNNLADWIKSQEKNKETKQKQIISTIIHNINTLIQDLDEKIKTLKEVDIDSKKVENRIKVIARGNLNSYIHNINILIKNLKNINQEKLQDLTEKIDKDLFNFKKNSDLNYQKATFLIGKEMADIKKTFFDFSKELKKIITKNKEIIDSSRQLSSIQINLNQLTEINGTIKEFNEKITQSKEKIKNNRKEIEKVQTSKNYKDNLKKQQQITNKTNQLTKDFLQLKSLINFKKLCNIFHSSKPMMDSVKSYKERFESSFLKDNGAELLEILEEAKLDTDIIITKIKAITTINQQLIKGKSLLKTIDIQNIKKLIQQTEHLKEEIIEENKKINKLKIKKEIIKKEIQQQLKKLNIKLIWKTKELK